LPGLLDAGDSSETLELLPHDPVALPGLDEGIAALSQAEKELRRLTQDT